MISEEVSIKHALVCVLYVITCMCLVYCQSFSESVLATVGVVLLYLLHVLTYWSSLCFVKDTTGGVGHKHVHVILFVDAKIVTKAHFCHCKSNNSTTEGF